MKAHMELLCPACGWSKSCGPLDMVEQMRTVRMLRAGAAVEPAFLFELFGAAAGKSTCPDCQHQGLSAIPEDDSPSQWPSARSCAICFNVISRERVAAMPEVRYCANCQGDIEKGKSRGEPDYCPRCGNVREMRANNQRYGTRYTMYCTTCRR